MKVEINNKEQNTEIKFPCLMIGKEHTHLVLIEGVSDCGSLYKGMALKHPEGIHYSEEWSKNFFRPLNGSITLSND